ncbi:uncharacterized protein LOC116920117 [Daphnia magna]|uniref:uncharacterized protein LOC116920117 n=1 Tax=Daphnia magna TaxID=35525 RepID=UPI001E1BA4EF|nr:uncharacterized protein LOC116920117 [Daphnia magna]
MPVAGPNQIAAGPSNMCANYEDLLADFHMQEIERFRHPITTFTYRFNGQTKAEYLVGPVRTDPKITRGSKLKAYEDYMTDRRPVSATMYALVRDAIALLDGGQGSLHDILEKLYASQFIKRTFGGKTPMKPKLVIALSSYILPKLVSEDNPCVSVNRISDGPSQKTIYTYKFQSYNKEDLEKIPQRDCKSKKTSSYRGKTPVQSSDLAVKEILPYSPPITPSPVFTIPGAKTLPASTPNSFERKLPHSASPISHFAISSIIPGDSPEDIPGDSPEDIPGDSPEDIPGDSPEDIPGDFPVNILEDIPEDQKLVKTSLKEQSTVLYLLGEEDVPIEDRTYRNFPIMIQIPSDLEPVCQTFFFSVPKTWSEDKFSNIAIEWIRKLVENEQFQE